MKDNLVRLLFALMVIEIVAIAAFNGWYKFQNPDMTSTRIFLETWHIQLMGWGTVIICLLGLHALIHRD